MLQNQTYHIFLQRRGYGNEEARNGGRGGRRKNYREKVENADQSLLFACLLVPLPFLYKKVHIVLCHIEQSISTHTNTHTHLNNSKALRGSLYQ